MEIHAAARRVLVTLHKDMSGKETSKGIQIERIRMLKCAISNGSIFEIEPPKMLMLIREPPNSVIFPGDCASSPLSVAPFSPEWVIQEHTLCG